MKPIKIFFMATVFLMLTAIYGYPVEDIVRIDNTVFDHPQRSGAIFDHDEHNANANLEDDCSVCHHVYENKKLVLDESSEDSMCFECHTLKSTSRNTIPLRMAFHNRCKTCHFDSKKGPVLCGECHTRHGRKL